MVRRVIQIDEENVTVVEFVRRHATRARSASWTERQNCSVMITVTDLATVCQTVRSERSLFIEREAAAYDEAAVQENKKKKMQAMGQAPVGGCPGSRMRQLERKPAEENQNAGSPVSSQLRQWPVQIKLAPVNAPYFDGAKLLIAADCTAYAYGSFHQDFIRGKVTLIGCPKLDDVDYSEKLTEIIRNNDIKSVTVVRMEVPCCGGLEHAAVTALKNSGKFIPWNVVTISIDGKILD